MHRGKAYFKCSWLLWGKTSSKPREISLLKETAASCKQNIWKSVRVTPEKGRKKRNPLNEQQNVPWAGAAQRFLLDTTAGSGWGCRSTASGSHSVRAEPILQGQELFHVFSPGWGAPGTFQSTQGMALNFQRLQSLGFMQSPFSVANAAGSEHLPRLLGSPTDKGTEKRLLTLKFREVQHNFTWPLVKGLPLLRMQQTFAAVQGELQPDPQHFSQAKSKNRGVSHENLKNPTPCTWNWLFRVEGSCCRWVPGARISGFYYHWFNVRFRW